MKVSVNHEDAYKIILNAIQEAKRQKIAKSESASLISDVILGSHLTYRYILVTGLLAKATNELVNPLALQAAADVEGAYDARSLCHAVIVGKVEESFLQGRLGASNEPFLNKPARYQTHSTLNAARKGYDKSIQAKSIDILKGAINKNIAYEMLIDAMFFTLQRNNRVINVPEGELLDFYGFIDKSLSVGIDGETCAVIASLSLNILAEKNSWKVLSHPVNQAGTSSKEILDIDVFLDDAPIISIEVKDKTFGYSDINHAIHKALSSGVYNVIFIKGIRANIMGSSEDDAIKLAGKAGVLLTFTDIKNFALTCYAITGVKNKDFIAAQLNLILKSIRAKDATVEHISSSLK